MAANREVAAMLIDACLTAGVDPDHAFEHLDDRDVAEYGRALAERWFPAADLPKFMQSLAESVATGRCLCRRCCAGRRQA